MEILLARHGNTFGPGDKVVWVGRETDLPLVEKGWAQARAVGEALAARNWVPNRILCATLRRTRGFADTVAALAAPGVSVEADARLNEVDYGAWAGRTTEEIEALPGAGDRSMAEIVRAWSHSDAWPPPEAGWGSSETEIKGALSGFIVDVVAMAPANSRLLVVSSNGILRFLPRLLGAVARADPQSLVVKTGHAGLLTGSPGTFSLTGWNLPPDALAELLGARMGYE